MAPAFTERKMRFAERLKDARKRSGMSQERAAQHIGTSRRHWIRWETGETMPHQDYLARISTTLEAPELLEFADDDEEAARVSARVDMLEVLYAQLGEALGKVTA